MELEQLQHFSAVVEEGSFADATQCLDLQPANRSAAIRSMGREWGAELPAPAVHGAVWRGCVRMATARRCQRNRPDLVSARDVDPAELVDEPVVASLRAYREQCRPDGRGDREAAAAPPITSVPLP